MKNGCMLAAVALCFMVVAGGVSEAGKIGVVAVEGRFPDAGSLVEIAEALGYDAVLIGQDDLSDTERLGAYNCIILSFPHSYLYEEEYVALGNYVKEGGTLLLTRIASYWMAMNPEDRLASPRRRIDGGGPFAEVTGVRINSSHPGIVKKFRVVEKKRWTEGLPDEFSYETSPPYDMHDERSRWRTECYPLNTEGAVALVESEAFYEEVDPESGSMKYNMEEPKTFPFFTVNKHGEGKTFWLACRPETLILSRQERHILQMFSNVLKYSMEK